jgi:hypothetical protein
VFSMLAVAGGGSVLSRYMKWVFFFCSCVLITACSQSPDTKFVGEWQSGCHMDVCTTTSLRADHTFSVKHDEKGSTAGYSGTWRTEGDQLIGQVTARTNHCRKSSAKTFALPYRISTEIVLQLHPRTDRVAQGFGNAFTDFHASI